MIVLPSGWEDELLISVIDDRYYLPKLTMGVRMELAMMKI